MAKLFVSFTGTMYALQSGRVSAEDLDEGLFVFGCTRDHAITPGVNDEYVEEIVNERPDLHELLVAALTKAESDGRVRWRTLETNVTFALVDELLTANGYEPLVDDDDSDDWRASYSYPAVAALSSELFVIWRG